MIDNNEGYQEFPPIIVGGPTGNYSVVCDVTSARWAEFNILNVSNGDVNGAAAVIVSGLRANNAGLNYVGAAGTSLDSDHHEYGIAFRLGPTTTLTPVSGWMRISNSEKKVFVRIDAQNSCSAYVTLQFRARLVTTVPGPNHEVHPDYQQEMNKARADVTKQRLNALGIPAYAQEGK